MLKALRAKTVPSSGALPGRGDYQRNNIFQSRKHTADERDTNNAPRENQVLRRRLQK